MSRFLRHRGGAAAVEFVLVLPLLAIVLYGTVDIGRMWADYRTVEHGVRDAARYLARADSTELGLDCEFGSIDESAPPALAAMNLAMTGTPDGSGDFVLGYWRDAESLAAAGLTVSVHCVDNSSALLRGLYADTDAIPRLEVSAAVPFPLLNGWAFGRGAEVMLTARHRQPYMGGPWGL